MKRAPTRCGAALRRAAYLVVACVFVALAGLAQLARVHGAPVLYYLLVPDWFRTLVEEAPRVADAATEPAERWRWGDEQFRVSRLSGSPNVTLIHDFMPTDEVHAWLSSEAGSLPPATLDTTESIRLFGERGWHDELMSVLYRLIRTSKGVMTAGRAPELVARLARRVQALTGGLSARCMEAPFLSRYDAGDVFRAHYDLYDVDNTRPFPPPSAHNARSFTLLVFLSDALDGGETEFMKAEGGRPLRVRPRAGSALLWGNCVLSEARPSPESSPESGGAGWRPDCVAREPSSLHQGRAPAIGSTKHTLTVWLRQRPIEPERMATLCGLLYLPGRDTRHDAALHELCQSGPSAGAPT